MQVDCSSPLRCPEPCGKSTLERSYLQTLAQQAKEEAPDDLTKSEASEAIDQLQQRR
jgi:hypothetical protein